MVPRNLPSAFSSSSRLTSPSAVLSICPVISWVSVATPRRRCATYSFSSASANSTALVARPANTAKTPVAMGSSVPECPTRFSWHTPLSFAATSWLVQSRGLSTINIPFISRSGRWPSIFCLWPHPADSSACSQLPWHGRRRRTRRICPSYSPRGRCGRIFCWCRRPSHGW